MGRPNDRRNFVHKRLLGGIKGFVSSGFNPLAGVAGFLGGGGGGRAGPAVRATPGPRTFPVGATFPGTFQPSAVTARRITAPPPRMTVRPSARAIAQPTLLRPPARAVAPRTLTARPSLASAAEKNRARSFKFPEFIDETARRLGIIGGNGNGCDPPLIMSEGGNCIAPTSPRGAELFGADPILGQYGAGFIAGTQLVDKATCPRGTVLGSDGICYNRTQITNKQRMWPAGRKPLLTGGDLRALSTAARAGRRLEGATKRLQRLGLMKKPAARSRPSPRRQRTLTAGDVHIHD